MQELLLFLKKYEVWVYVLSALIGLVYLQKLIIAYQDWRACLFGMER
jgi:hypothetical protein